MEEGQRGGEQEGTESGDGGKGAAEAEKNDAAGGGGVGGGKGGVERWCGGSRGSSIGMDSGGG